MSDGALTDCGHVTVTVTAVNDAPVAVDDAATTDEDTAKVFTQADAEGQRHGRGQHQRGAVGDGGVEPDQRHGGAQRGRDGHVHAGGELQRARRASTTRSSDGALTDTGHVTVTVTAVNDAPVAVDDAATTDEDTARCSRRPC